MKLHYNLVIYFYDDWKRDSANLEIETVALHRFKRYATKNNPYGNIQNYPILKLAYTRRSIHYISYTLVMRFIRDLRTSATATYPRVKD